MRTFDAIVVLGCRVRSSGEPSAALRRRLDAASRAYRAQGAGLLLLSGGKVWGEHSEARIMASYLEAQGLPAEALRLETWSRSTVENAVCSAVLLRREGARRLGVVSCAWHLPRALRSFRALGFEAQGLPAEKGPSSPLRELRRALGERLRGLKDALLLPHLGELEARVERALDASEVTASRRTRRVEPRR